MKKNTLRQTIFITVTLLVLIAITLFIFIYAQANKTVVKENAETSSISPPTPEAPETLELYKGTVITISNLFSVKVPNGWSASISNNPTYTAVIFSKQNQLDELVYKENTLPTINEGGFPLQNGLTEHFFIIAPSESQQFTKEQHQQVTMESFTFDDDTIGEKYYVVKYAPEAANWGGLQKDTEWQGRTYIYQTPQTRVEAHLALYPSSTIDLELYENVVRSITKI